MSANEQTFKCDQPEYSAINRFLVIHVLEVGGIRKTPCTIIGSVNSIKPQVVILWQSANALSGLSRVALCLVRTTRSCVRRTVGVLEAVHKWRHAVRGLGCSVVALYFFKSILTCVEFLKFQNNLFYGSRGWKNVKTSVKTELFIFFYFFAGKRVKIQIFL